MTVVQEIAALMAAHDYSPSVQDVQTQFRMNLVKSWGIPEGAKILEIGCGQGDMTAVLAAAVGDGGHVTAVDIADPSYGAPVTIGESAAHLMRTPLGGRITFHFQYDVLNPACPFAADAFDIVVMAHCAWYFASLEQIRQVLRRVRAWAPRLCFSEWNMEPQAFDQTAHMLAILIQGQVEAHKSRSEANVRTPFSKAEFHKVLRKSGWEIAREGEADSRLLQDAKWEIDACLQTSADEADALFLPSKLRDLIDGQLDILRSLAQSGENRSLPSYTIVAERAWE